MPSAAQKAPHERCNFFFSAPWAPRGRKKKVQEGPRTRQLTRRRLSRHAAAEKCRHRSQKVPQVRPWTRQGTPQNLRIIGFTKAKRIILISLIHLPFPPSGRAKGCDRTPRGLHRARQGGPCDAKSGPRCAREALKQIEDGPGGPERASKRGAGWLPSRDEAASKKSVKMERHNSSQVIPSNACLGPLKSLNQGPTSPPGAF